MGNLCKRKYSQFENRKLVSKKIFANDKNFELKDLLEKVRRWPANCENCKCFICMSYMLICIVLVPYMCSLEESKRFALATKTALHICY